MFFSCFSRIMAGGSSWKPFFVCFYCEDIWVGSKNSWKINWKTAEKHYYEHPYCFCLRLYPSRWLHRIQKKMWLSTHFERGPIPCECIIWAPVSPRRPHAPLLDASPKHSLVSIAKLSSSCKQVTSLGHCSGLIGIVLYASLMSCTAACEPGERCQMRRQMVENVPHVQGYWSESMELLIEVMECSGEWGEERFWMSWNLAGCPGFGMRLSGEVWKNQEEFLLLLEWWGQCTTSSGVQFV